MQNGAKPSVRILSIRRNRGLQQRQRNLNGVLLLAVKNQMTGTMGFGRPCGAMDLM